MSINVVESRLSDNSPVYSVAITQGTNTVTLECVDLQKAIDLIRIICEYAL